MVKLKDDGQDTIKRYRKRCRREGYYLSTFLRKEGIKSGSNGVERVNRRFMVVRSDGGGNRTQRGIDANSVLFAIMATNWINGKNLYEHLVRSTSGDE